MVLVKELAEELHPGFSFNNISIESSLDKNGIDSLGRIELLIRIEKVFGLILPEEQAIGAERIIDLYQAMDNARSVSGTKWSDYKVTPKKRIKSAIPASAKTLPDLLDWHMEQGGERVHIHLYEPGAEVPDPVSYNDLYQQAMIVTAGLQARGIQYGDCVGIMLPTGKEYLYTFFGILLAGAVPIPIYPPQRLTHIEEHLKKQIRILSNARAKLLVTVPEALRLRPLLKPALPDLNDILTFPELVAGSGAARRVPVAPEDTAFIQYTSGSTGNPKGVILSHANLLANVRAMGQAVKAVPSDVFVSWLPLYHDMGLIGAWFGSLYFGMELVLMSPLSFMARPVRWLRAIHVHGGTLSAAPNFAYELCSSRIGDDELAGLDLSSWRRALNGAEPVLPGTLEKFEQRFRACGLKYEAIAPVYGLAENSVGLLFPPSNRGYLIDRVDRKTFYEDGEAVHSADESALRFVSCGSAIPAHEVRIVDEEDNVIKERCIGKLQFRGPSATLMYCRNPEATSSLFHGDWLDTGDYAYEADGEIYITGREKEMIIRGGRNIFPYELEEAISEIRSVRKGGVAVFGSRDDNTGLERLIVIAEVTERRPEKREKIRNEIIDKAVQLVQIPPDDIVLAELRTVLKTSSGKIRRATMKALYEADKLGQKRSVWLQVTSLALSGIPSLLRRYFKRMGETIYAGWMWFWFVLLVPPVWLSVVVLPFRNLRYFIMKTGCRLIVLLSFSRFKITGRENLPEERPLIIVSNHQTYVDAVFLIAALPVKLRFVAKGELRSNFFARIFLERIDAIFVERYDVKGSISDIRDIAKEKNGTDAPVVFFAEGTFTDLPGLRPFMMGAFLTAVETGAAVLPMALRGVRELLRGDRFYPRKSEVALTVAPVIQGGQDGWKSAVELRDTVRREILQNCGEKDLGESILGGVPGKGE